MNQSEFEKRVLELWVTTRIPLTRANVQYLTGAKRAQIDKWLEALVGGGILEMDADDDGEMVWTVRGARRSQSGPESVEELERLDKLRGEAGVRTSDSLSALTTMASTAAGALVRAASQPRSGTSRGPYARPGGYRAPATGERKSLVASGLLSFFFGPWGWLYAAPLKEAAPAVIIYLIACALMPHFLLVPLLGILQPLSALAGVGYALKFNANGERTPLLGSRDESPRGLPPRR